MKKIICLLFLVSSSNLFANKTLTDDFFVTKLAYNQELKSYDVSLKLMAGVYKADEKFSKCLVHSMEKKQAVKITYEAMGLKITRCE